MWRRLMRALRYAMREEDFAPALGAGTLLILIGTVTYTLGNDWKLVDGFYFAVATLTTSSIADPGLVLDDPWMKLFTVFYILIGIGILVEIVRRLGFAFVEVRRQEKAGPRGEAPESGE
jgi:Ion channel